MNTVAPPSYWDAVYSSSKLRYREERVEFKDVFDSHLPKGGTCFEVGCYPGDFLIYLCKRFGYVANGIDTTPDVEFGLPDHFRRQGVSVGQFSRENFFDFKSSEKFDVVCSFGFVEHFTEYKEVIRRHVDLVKAGGMLFLSCPNFRRFQYCLHRLFDAQNLSRHVLQAMDLDAWREVLRDSGMEVVESGYYRTFDFWVERQGRSRMQMWAIRKIGNVGREVDRRIVCPNRFTSPFMYCLARRSP